MEVLDLGPGLHALGYVEVHLVAVEVSVVGRRHGQVHPKGGPWQHLILGEKGRPDRQA